MVRIFVTFNFSSVEKGCLGSNANDKRILRLANHYRISRRCGECHRPGNPYDLVYCPGCCVSTRPAHRSCLAHKPAHLSDFEDNEDSPKCEELSFTEYVYISFLISSDYHGEDEQELHLDDLETTWFGVPREQSCYHYPQLYIWPRLDQIVTEADHALSRQYPSLVSFVGETGSGKSTLIRALIRMLDPFYPNHHDVPVPAASRNHFTSTSSDVHLFWDPRTRLSDTPLYFVGEITHLPSYLDVSNKYFGVNNIDCEGLSPHDDPTSSRIAREEDQGERSTRSRTDEYELKNRTKLHRDMASITFDLKWGGWDRRSCPNDEGPQASRPTEQHNHRVKRATTRLAVSQLYPRLLYPFSDVVCFVATNPRYCPTRSTQFRC